MSAFDDLRRMQLSLDRIRDALTEFSSEDAEMLAEAIAAKLELVAAEVRSAKGSFGSGSYGERE